ncbi:TolC family protein [Rhizobium leguminosarum]|nr:TolC family protein [Rhizobium leguminosarum]
MNDYIRKAGRDLAAATANIGVAESRALRAQVKTTQETLALSIGSYKDGQSSLLDVLDAQRSVATSQANLAQAVQQMAKEYVTLNVAIGSGYNFGGAAIRPSSYEH